jgi:hypothetical protein
MGKFNKKEFEEYFREIVTELEREFEKSDRYSQKIDAELKKFDESLPGKNSQYYLIEHLKNAIELQAQRQSLIKDKFSIKKAILDYSIKTDADENEGKILFDELSKLVKLDKEKFEQIKKKIDEKDAKKLDEKIDELLEQSDED